MKRIRDFDIASDLERDKRTAHNTLRTAVATKWLLAHPNSTLEEFYTGTAPLNNGVPLGVSICKFLTSRVVDGVRRYSINLDKYRKYLSNE